MKAGNVLARWVDLDNYDADELKTIRGAMDEYAAVREAAVRAEYEPLVEAARFMMRSNHRLAVIIDRYRDSDEQVTMVGILNCLEQQYEKLAAALAALPVTGAAGEEETK